MKEECDKHSVHPAGPHRSRLGLLFLFRFIMAAHKLQTQPIKQDSDYGLKDASVTARFSIHTVQLVPFQIRDSLKRCVIGTRTGRNLSRAAEVQCFFLSRFEAFFCSSVSSCPCDPVTACCGLLFITGSRSFICTPSRPVFFFFLPNILTVEAFLSTTPPPPPPFFVFHCSDLTPVLLLIRWVSMHISTIR